MENYPLFIIFLPDIKDEEFLPSLEKIIAERYKTIIDTLAEMNRWDSSIKEIIFSYNMNSSIDAFNEQWKTYHSHLTKEKEYMAAGKTLHNPDGEFTLILPLVLWLEHTEENKFVEFLDKLFIYQAMIAYSKTILPQELYELWLSEQPKDYSNINETLKWRMADWCCHLLTGILYQRITGDSFYSEESHEIYLINFKRRLKKILYQSQSDEEKTEKRWFYLWTRYVVLFDSLIKRLLDNETNNEKLKLKNEKEAENIYGVINEVNDNLDRLLNGKEIDITKTQTFFHNFATIYNIHIFDCLDEEKGMNFTFYTDPKKLFRNEIIETEQRIVAFVDILGFSNMIQEYDSNPISTLLQDIQEVFALSVKNTFDHYRQNATENFLEYKLFSDNLCASIPFYDSEDDFLSQFQILVHLLRGYQSMMMGKGYFVRGAITIGSYYSDENMIFSGGLVRAYQLETKKDGAVFPRIILDDNIMKMLEVVSPEKYESKGNKDLIVYSETDGKYFLNPYIDIKYTLQQLKPALSELFIDDDPLFSKNMETLKNLLGSIIDLQSASLPEETTSISAQVNAIQLILNDQKSRLDINIEIEREVLRKLEWLCQYNEWMLSQNSQLFRFYIPSNQKIN